MNEKYEPTEEQKEKARIRSEIIEAAMRRGRQTDEETKKRETILFRISNRHNN
jgi:hypothetical protein